MAGYAVYLAIWCLLTVALSTLVHRANLSLVGLLVLWAAAIILVPRVAVSTASTLVEAPGKIETDFAMRTALKAVGDGHNAADPAFEQLKANMLAQYGVDKIEDLPVNFRGVVAGKAEANLTDIMNKFAESKMASEITQKGVADYFAFLSPVIALRDLSTTLAGVDIKTHHRFLREAERVRFDFVQGLNKAHAEQMAYTDDINRSRDPGAEKRTRVTAENWQILEDFKFKSEPASSRISSAMGAFGGLVLWLLGAVGFCFYVARRKG